MVAKTTVEEREAAARELIGGSGSSSASLPEPKDNAMKSKNPVKTTKYVLSTSSHHDTKIEFKGKRPSRGVSPSARLLSDGSNATKQPGTDRGRSSFHSPPPKSRHSKTAKDQLSLSSHGGKRAGDDPLLTLLQGSKNVGKLKSRPMQISRSVSPDYESEGSQNEPSPSKQSRGRRRVTVKPNRGVSPRRATTHGKNLARKPRVDKNVKDGRRSHRHTKHLEGTASEVPPKRSSGGHHHDSRRHQQQDTASSRGRGSDTSDDCRRSSSHGPARRGRGSGGLVKQRSLRGNLGRQHSLRGLARQESMQQETLKKLLIGPMNGFSDSEDETDDNLHLYGFPGVNLPAKADQTSIVFPRHGARPPAAPRLTAASLRQRLNGEDNAAPAEDAADNPWKDEEEDKEYVSGPNEKVVLPFGEDEVKRKRKESARQAAAKDQPQFADLHDDF